jgi:hypothetical protein
LWQYNIKEELVFPIDFWLLCLCLLFCLFVLNCDVSKEEVELLRLSQWKVGGTVWNPCKQNHDNNFVHGPLFFLLFISCDFCCSFLFGDLLDADNS